MHDRETVDEAMARYRAVLVNMETLLSAITPEERKNDPEARDVALILAAAIEREQLALQGFEQLRGRLRRMLNSVGKKD